MSTRLDRLKFSYSSPCDQATAGRKNKQAKKPLIALKLLVFIIHGFWLLLVPGLIHRPRNSLNKPARYNKNKSHRKDGLKKKPIESSHARAIAHVAFTTSKKMISNQLQRQTNQKKRRNPSPCPITSPSDSFPTGNRPYPASKMPANKSRHYSPCYVKQKNKY